MLNTEWLYAFPVCIMTVCPLFGDNVVLEIAPTVMSEKKRNKSHTDWKEEIKFSLFDMIVCIKKKKSLRIDKWVQQGCKYKANTQKSHICMY